MVAPGDGVAMFSGEVDGGGFGVVLDHQAGLVTSYGHLRDVAVPVRVSVKKIGAANLVCARTRPKFVGGARAVYDDALSGGDIKR